MFSFSLILQRRRRLSSGAFITFAKVGRTNDGLGLYYSLVVCVHRYSWPYLSLYTDNVISIKLHLLCICFIISVHMPHSSSLPIPPSHTSSSTAFIWRPAAAGVVCLNKVTIDNIPNRGNNNTPSTWTWNLQSSHRFVSSWIIFHPQLHVADIILLVHDKGECLRLCSCFSNHYTYLSTWMTTIHLHGAHVTLCSVVRGCHKLIIQHSLIRQTDFIHPRSPSTHHPQEGERVRCAYHGRSEVGIPSIRVKGSFPIPGGTHRHTRESVSLSITNMVTYTWIYASQIWTGN